MKGRLRLVLTFFRLGILGELAYRTNFYVQVLQSIVSLLSAIAGLLIVFSHTDTLAGWQPEEVLAVLGVYLMAGGVIGTVVRPSMERFMEDVRKGTLDYTLTKPEDAQFLVSFGEIRIWKVVDVILGAAVLAVAVSRHGATVGVGEALVFGAVLVAGAATVYSFWLIMATLSFWFIRIENILVIFEAMYQAGRWPVGIYPGWLRFILTFLVPIAFAVTVPAEGLIGRLTPGRLLLAFGVAIALIVLSRFFWLWGLRNYTGASA